MAASRPLVVVQVGEDHHPFSVEDDKLCGCSPFFRSALSGGFHEASERIVRLPEVEVETFQVFAKWLSDRNEEEWHTLDWKLLWKC